MKPDDVGAEIDEKFLKHLGPNREPIKVVEGWRDKHKLTQYSGSGLSQELYRALQAAGMRRAAIFFHDPKLEGKYEEAMEIKIGHCLILITKDGYVVNLFPDMWYKVGS